MSNQTFVKKDRISFAENLNEQEVIAPFSNALYVGPNSAITYDGDSNVVSINYLQGVTLSNQYIYADGTYLSNLPTAITSANLVSTVVGLGTVGYISTATGGLTQSDLTSSITGLGTVGYISSLSLTSTVTGLGTIYLSTNSVPSTIIGLGTFGYLSTNIVPSTIVGLGTFGYLSTNSVPSTIVGLGTFGYLSTNIVPSTIVGLGTFGYLSTNSVPSTIVGLGTFGYLSTNIVPSTILGLGTFGYLSTNIVPSTIVGLGTFGYLSTNIVPSTIIGLGTFGYVSSLTSISTNNISAGNLFAGIISSLQFNASSINANRAGINFLTGSNNGFNTFTNNLFPTSQSATLGFIGTGENGGGWYSNINGRQINCISTNTNIIGSATGAGDIRSTVRVLGTLSTMNINTSTIIGNGSQLFNLNAISSLSLTSTIVGLGTFGYLSTNTVPSTIVGLGTFGYLSTNTVPSTIVGLGTFGYLSTNIVPSTIVGLGTFGYISSTQLTSTIVGLGTSGYISSTQLISTMSNWSLYDAKSSINMLSNNIDYTNEIILTGGGNNFLGLINFYYTNRLYYNKYDATHTFVDSRPVAQDWSYYQAENDVDIASFNINNVNITTTENIASVGGTITVNNSHFIPSVDDSYDLGSATNRWRELYVAGTSIHLGNSLVLSEDIDGKLSTNAMIVSSINVENLSTGSIKAQLIFLENPAAIAFNTDSVLTGGIGYSHPNMTIESPAGDINITATNINVDGNLDMSDNEIRNVLQTQTVTSATTNLCLPTSNFITDSNTLTFSNDLTPNYIQILTNTIPFPHVFPFSKYKVHFSFYGETNTGDRTGDNYFYFTLTPPSASAIYGATYNSITPYKLQQNIISNYTSFNYTDIFEIITPICNADPIIVYLYAVSDFNTCNYLYRNVNCFVVTEPVV